ncbi:MAG: acyltransferase [Chitinophagales bacterium]|nr:acyltransferase [Chitinophagales bacterium]
MNKLYLIFYYLIIYPIYKIQFGNIGSRARIKSPLRLDGKRNIFIGKNVNIQKHTWLASISIDGKDPSRLEIGDGSVIGHFNHIYCTHQIIIGKKVLTADKVYISDNTHEFKDIEVPILDQPVRNISSVSVGDGAWLGENVCIIGANVGKNSVIGANSVVTRDIPDFAVAVGSPAIVIKRYCIEDKIWKKTNSKGEFI